MKTKHLIIGGLAFLNTVGEGQTLVDSLEDKVNKTEIELVYNHYIQDGNNSAVTGGVGTEELTVYSSLINIKKIFGDNSLSFNMGADVITSASTDNINFIISSASRTDARIHAKGTYTNSIEKHDLEIYGGIGFSLESDYFSVGSKIGFSKEGKNNMRNYTAEFQMFNDDLRWGRLDGGNFKPQNLIYPSELRYQEWHDIYRRNSYNLKLGFTQIINRRNIIGIFPEMGYQTGLLSTPFHRVYFTNGDVRVEQLPERRMKGSVAIKLNSFVGGNVILKNTINPYIDNFGVVAFSLEQETAIKLTPQLVLLPNVRFYTQKGATFFKSYGEHEPNDEFYTSDYDYDNLQTYKIGIGTKYSPFKFLNKKMKFNTLLFRYNVMFRNRNLTAHIFSLSLQTEFNRKKKKPKI